MNQLMHKRANHFKPINIHTQRGATLVLVLVVLMALTFIGVSSTGSNRLQTVMARNAQFQVEAWNESYREISTRVITINERSVSEGIPTYISKLIKGSPAECVNGDSGSDCSMTATSSGVKTVTKIALENVKCYNEEDGSSVGTIATNDLRLEVDSDLYDGASSGAKATGIGSDQRQRFTYSYTLSQSGICLPEEEVDTAASIPAAPTA